MKHDICLNGPIPSWDEGLPLGNGGMGCLIWGPLHALRFSMDLARLWDLTPAPVSYTHLTLPTNSLV